MTKKKSFNLCKINLKKTILYRVEGGFHEGMGHIYRSDLLLLNLKKNYNIIILTKYQTVSYFFFKKKNFKIYSHNEKNLKKKIELIKKKEKIDLFINDYINIKYHVSKFFEKEKINAIYLDTLNIIPKKHIFCIDTFLDKKKKYLNYFQGLEYVILDPKINSLKNTIKKKLNITIHFGGSDEKNLSYKIFKLIKKIDKIDNIIIILGPAVITNVRKKFYNLSLRYHKLKILNSPKNLYDAYKNTTLGIISGGNNLFNFCSAGINNISISTNFFEKKNCEKMKDLNLTDYAGHYNRIHERIIINKIIDFKNFPENKKKFTSNGVVKIIKIIQNILKIN